MATIKENCKKLRKYLQPLKIEKKKTKMSYSKDDILFVIRKKERKSTIYMNLKFQHKFFFKFIVFLVDYSIK